VISADDFIGAAVIPGDELHLIVAARRDEGTACFGSGLTRKNDVGEGVRFVGRHLITANFSAPHAASSLTSSSKRPSTITGGTVLPTEPSICVVYSPIAGRSNLGA
jgi:hypothetical protein